MSTNKKFNVLDRINKIDEKNKIYSPKYLDQFSIEKENRELLDNANKILSKVKKELKLATGLNYNDPSTEGIALIHKLKNKVIDYQDHLINCQKSYDQVNNIKSG